MTKGHFFTLFSNCKVVLGAKEMAIYDLQYGDVYKFPLALSAVLDKIIKIPKAEYPSHFDQDTCQALDQYLTVLEDADLGHYTNNPEWFPPISDEWDFPADITNAILELNNNSEHLQSAISQLDELNCKALEIRIYDAADFNKISAISSQTLNTGIQSVQLFLANCTSEISKEQWLTLMQANPRLFNIFIFNTTEDKALEIEDKYNIFYLSQSLHNTACGKIDQKYFSVNIPTFTESQHHNSCLNRKISIDTEGNIKNCPSMTESFGNIKDTTLLEALEKPGFKKYWNINKDKIHVCKDCEFRYICTDCRAYVEDPEDIYSKPLKCGYNPYTAEWSEWSTNPLKQKAIQFYGMEEMIAENSTKN